MSQSQTPQEITVKGKATRIRGATWTHDQVKKLFDVWTQPDIYNGLLNEKKKLDIFKNMAVILSTLGVSRTWRECRAKIKNLKADFRKAMEKKTPFRYYDEMKKIMNLDGSSTLSSGASRIDTYFAPRATSTPSRSQSEHSQEERPCSIPSPISEHRDDATPSTSRSAIQSVIQHTPYQSPIYSLEQRAKKSEHGSSISPSTSSEYLQYPLTPEKTHRSPYQHYHYESQDEHREDWRQIRESVAEEDSQHERQRDTSTADDPMVEYDTSSRSSMIITHVVSNVIEPVTQVVMPSSSGVAGVSKDLEIIQRQEPTVMEELHQSAPTPPPIRLEFVLENENVILQTPQSPSRDEGGIDIRRTEDTNQADTLIIPTTPPAVKELPKTPPSQILRQRLKQQPKTSKKPHAKSPAPSLTSSFQKKSYIPPTPRSTPSRTPRPPKRRKLFETLNQKTVETISDLLTETSQKLLQELQDAEQRFICWEEEKRKEDRKREEALFTKLITTMKSSFSATPCDDSTPEIRDPAPAEDDELTSHITSVSKRINEAVCDEVKQTEESVRQWEQKMQRQESRHTEKLFAMIINAIKTSANSNGD